MPFTKSINAPSLDLDPYSKKAIDAIVITKKFISDRRLVCYGGTALDYAARLMGSKIYDDEKLTIPDLDFFSTDPWKDACELADILYAAGYEDTRVINALHVGTFRVDIGSNHFIADIGYMPILDNVYTLTYEGFRVIHPDYQRLDMHSSLSFLYDNPPREVVFARLAKDIERFNVINALYPIPAGSGLPRTEDVSTFSQDYVYAGLTAWGIKGDIIEVACHDVGALDVDVISEHYPLGNILPAMTFAKNKKGEKMIIYDTSDRLLSINTSKHVRYSCDSFILRTVLGWMVYHRMGIKAPYPFTVGRTYDELAGVYHELLPRVTLSAKYYGDENIDHNTMIFNANYDKTVDGTELPDDIALPTTYRPKNGKPRGSFSYDDNVFFIIDGRKMR